jgi:hypothetical protein
MEVQSTKLQDPEKIQTPSSSARALSWMVDLDVSPELGVWSLDVPAAFSLQLGSWILVFPRRFLALGSRCLDLPRLSLTPNFSWVYQAAEAPKTVSTVLSSGDENR